MNHIKEKDGVRMNQPPTVGRIVHYRSFGTPKGEYTSQCRAAVVTEVTGPDEVSLAILNPTGMFFNESLPQDESPAPKGGTWHWPERV